jgi:hypothetical protein
MPTAAAVVACALALLGKSEAKLPRIALVDSVPKEASAQVEGYVRESDKTIYLVTTSPVFVAAMRSRAECGDPVAVKKLASIIAHEEWHVRHGMDERGAYHAQLTTLLSIGVAPDNALYTSVVRSMMAVLKKKNAKPEMVLAGGTNDKRP